MDVQGITNKPGRGSCETQVRLSKSVNLYHEGALRSYSAIVQFLLERYAKDDNVEKMEAEVHRLRKGSMIPALFEQAL